MHIFSDNSFCRDDKIFAISNYLLDYYWYSSVFEILEINGALKIKLIDDLTASFSLGLLYPMNFPQTITPMQSGKFLFHPLNFFEGKMFFIEVEESENNQSYYFSNIDFPLDISDEDLFIFKV